MIGWGTTNFWMVDDDDDDDDESYAHESEEKGENEMKYYIEYRNENGTTAKKTPLLTAEQIKSKFRQLMAKEVVIECVRTEDHDKVNKPGHSEYDDSRKFRLKYRKEGRKTLRYTPWSTMDGTQKKFYRMLGKYVFLGIEEQTSKGIVPEKSVKGKRGRPQKEDAFELDKELQKHLVVEQEKEHKLRKKRNTQLMLLVFIGVGLLVLSMFLSALKSPSDMRQASIASDMSSSGTDEDNGTGAAGNILAFLLPVTMIVILVMAILPMVKNGMKGF